MKRLLLIIFSWPIIMFGSEDPFWPNDVSSIDSIYENSVKNIELLVDSLIEVDYSTSGMVYAVGIGIEQYDILLNKYYNLLKENLPDAEFNIIRDSQRKWLNYREEYLAYNRDNYPPHGTIYRNMYMGLQLDLIHDRVDVLFKFYRTIKQGYSKYKFVQNTGDIKLWTGDF